MAVQQDQLNASNTGVKFETINNDRVDRLFHNGTDIVKCRFQYPEITESIQGYTSTITETNPRFFKDAAYLFDSAYVPPSNSFKTYYYRIKYSRPVTFNVVKFYSSQELLAASLNSVVLTSTAGPTISIASRSSAFRGDLSPAQFEHTLNLTSNTTVQGLVISIPSPVEAFNVVSEIEVGTSLPKSNIIYFGTDGVQKSSFTAQKSNLIDMCYNPATGNYYTVRYNSVSGAFYSPDDDFTTPSGSSGFNTDLWDEDLQDTSFFRSITNNNLVFSTTSGKGALYSNAVFPNNYELELDFSITTLTGSSSFFGLHAVEQDTLNLIYGVGITARGGDNYYKACVKSYTDNSAGSFSLRRLAPTLSGVFTGAETWTITYTGTDSGNKLFSVVGSVNGTQASASGPNHIINYSNPFIAFEVLASENVAINDNISFIMDYEVASRAVTSGTLNLQKSAGDNFTSAISGVFAEVIPAGPARALVVGSTFNHSVSVSGDNFELVGLGDYFYLNYPTLEIEGVTNQVQVSGNVIEALDVLQSNSVRKYSDIPFGAVQLAVNGAGTLFLKSFDKVYSMAESLNLTGLLTPPGSGVLASVSGLVPAAGVSSLHYSDESGGFLGYVEFDTFLSEVRLKTLQDSTPPIALSRQVFLEVPDFNETKTNDGVPYQFYLHSVDNTSLFYLRKNGSTELNTTITTGTAGTVTTGSPNFTDATKNFNTLLVKEGDLCIINDSVTANNGTYIITNIPTATSLNLAGPISAGNLINTPLTNRTTWTTQASIDYKIMSNAELLQYNLDPDITAFSAVNIDNYSLQAGTGEIGTITAEVINSWGEPLSGKTVTYAVIQGDAVVNPASSVTNASGIATTQLTVGATAGPIQVQTSISD